MSSKCPRPPAIVSQPRTLRPHPASRLVLACVWVKLCTFLSRHSCHVTCHPNAPLAGWCDPGVCGTCSNLCDEGSYPTRRCDGISPVSCAPCPVGHMCPEGALEPQPCPPGFAQNLRGKAGCEPCGDAQTSDGTGSVVCEGIAPGWYGVGGTSDSHTAQKPCQAGFYCPGGSTDEIPCPRDTYQPLTAQAACLPCREGSTAEPQQTACTPVSRGDDCGWVSGPANVREDGCALSRPSDCTATQGLLDECHC